jgi:hypothetical protein
MRFELVLVPSIYLTIEECMQQDARLFASHIGRSTT